MLYFAYGSNLNMVQMKKRCPDSVSITKVRLKNYKLVFNRVADIIKSEGDEVEGAIYEVSPRDIKNLDVYEGYPRLYTKVEVTVEDDNGKSYEVFVYVMVKKGLAEPQEYYYNTISQGFKDWDIPKVTLKKAKNQSKINCKIDSFFTQKHCDRCGGSLKKGRIMSMYNENCICLSCKDKERQEVDYSEAVEAEHLEIRKGNYNYKGIKG